MLAPSSKFAQRACTTRDLHSLKPPAYFDVACSSRVSFIFKEWACEGATRSDPHLHLFICTGRIDRSGILAQRSHMHPDTTSGLAPPHRRRSQCHRYLQQQAAAVRRVVVHGRGGGRGSGGHGGRRIAVLHLHGGRCIAVLHGSCNRCGDISRFLTAALEEEGQDCHQGCNANCTEGLHGSSSEREFMRGNSCWKAKGFKSRQPSMATLQRKPQPAVQASETEFTKRPVQVCQCQAAICVAFWRRKALTTDSPRHRCPKPSLLSHRHQPNRNADTKTMIATFPEPRSLVDHGCRCRRMVPQKVFDTTDIITKN